MSSEDTKAQIDQFQDDFAALREEIEKVVIGQTDVVLLTLIGLLSGGHVLIEGVPGLGKTLLAKTLADTIDLQFRRIQFTPDLMPADVIGTYVVLESQGRRRFEFQQGPIFTNLLLADEINRSTPKTQSAMLEAMAEGAVTVANETYEVPQPFFTIATQSPSEEDGTFPLPATQLDRFLFKVLMPFPSSEDLDAILEKATSVKSTEVEKTIGGARLLEMTHLAKRVPVAANIRKFAIDVVLATHPESEKATESTRRYVAAGSSPRGAAAMIQAGKVKALLDGRANVTQEDLAWAAKPALRHRISLNFEGHAEAVTTDSIIEAALGNS